MFQLYSFKESKFGSKRVQTSDKVTQTQTNTNDLDEGARPVYPVAYGLLCRFWGTWLWRNFSERRL